MILVVNPNPAVDTVAVVNFVVGTTLRPQRLFEWPGGSGVHAAQVAQRLGVETEIVCPLGGQRGERFRRLADQHGLTVHAVDVPTETRGTYSLLDPVRGRICDVAERGGTHPPEAVPALLDAVRERLGGAELVVVSGSTPPGWPVDLAARVVGLAHAANVPTIADVTGEALGQVVDAAPWMIKPSLEELHHDDLRASDPRGVMALVDSWLATGVSNVCLSLAADGVLWWDAGTVRHVTITPRRAFNPVGCGDTLVGAAAARTVSGDSVERALRWAVAAATDNLAYDAPGDCEPQSVARLFTLTAARPVDTDRVVEILGTALAS